MGAKDAINPLKDPFLLISRHPRAAQFKASDDALSPPFFGRHGRISETGMLGARFLVGLVEGRWDVLYLGGGQSHAAPPGCIAIMLLDSTVELHHGTSHVHGDGTDSPPAS